MCNAKSPRLWHVNGNPSIRISIHKGSLIVYWFNLSKLQVIVIHACGVFFLARMILLYTLCTRPLPGTHDLSLAHDVLMITYYSTCPYHLGSTTWCIGMRSTHLVAQLLPDHLDPPLAFLPNQFEPFPVRMLTDFQETLGLCPVMFFLFCSDILTLLRICSSCYFQVP